MDRIELLRQRLLAMSETSPWGYARFEWALDHIYDSSVPKACLCGKAPIMEICVIRNVRNGIVMEVGNVCIHKVLSVNTKRIFQGLKRIRKDPYRVPCIEVIWYAMDKNVGPDFDGPFLLALGKRRKMTHVEANKVMSGNLDILHYIDSLSASKRPQ